MRVLICIPTLRRGGAERQVRLLLPALVQAGVTVGLFARMHEGDVQNLKRGGIACFPVRAARNNDLDIFRQFREVSRAFAPEIVQTFLTQMDIVAGLARGRSQKWILCERTSRLHYQRVTGWGANAKEMLRSILGRRADLVVANSAAGLDVWPNAHRKKIVPNALLPPRVRKLEALRAGGQRLVRLVTVSRLVDTKRIDILVAAVKRLLDDGIDATLDILGEGPQRQALAELIERCGADEYIRLHGDCDNVDEWLQQADIFVSASLYEGQPNAVLEAAAVGTPLILSDIVEHRDALGLGATYCAGEDPECFARAIRDALADPIAVQERVQYATNRVLVQTPDRIAREYIGIYRELLAV